MAITFCVKTVGRSRACKGASHHPFFGLNTEYGCVIFEKIQKVRKQSKIKNFTIPRAITLREKKIRGGRNPLHSLKQKNSDLDGSFWRFSWAKKEGTWNLLRFNNKAS